jgi:hypothetical protein
MSTSDDRFSIPSVWSSLFFALKDSPWEDEDIDNALRGKNPDIRVAALTLRHIRTLATDWKDVDPDEAIRAVFKAASRHYGSIFLSSNQVREMAQHFVVCHRDFLDPLEEYLDEDCGPVRWHWLNDHGQQEIKKAVMKDSEIWVDDPDLSGVWVFNQPGRSA